MVRKGDQNFVPDEMIALASGDALMMIAESKSALAAPPPSSDGSSPGVSSRIVRLSTIIRVFVGKASVVGVPLATTRRCPRAFRRISCMSAAMTWTSCRRRT